MLAHRTPAGDLFSAASAAGLSRKPGSFTSLQRKPRTRIHAHGTIPWTSSGAFIIWEADDHCYGLSSGGDRDIYLNPGFTPPGGYAANLQPLNYLRQTSGFKAAFSNQLNWEKDEPFGYLNMRQRFDGIAQEFRKVLEAEAMRRGSLDLLHKWSYTYEDGRINPADGLPYNFASGVEQYRCWLSNDRVYNDQTFNLYPSRYTLCYVAAQTGLFTGTIPP